MDRLRAVAVWATAHPYLVLTLVAAVLWRYGVASAGGAGADWDTIVRASNAFTGHTGLHLYGQNPRLTFGPLALLVVVPLRYLGPYEGWQVTSAILFAAGIGCLWLLESAAGHAGAPSRKRTRAGLVLGGTLVLVAWIGPASVWGHSDDVFALLAVASAVWATAQDRWLLAGVMIGVGAAFKPWAIFAVALAVHGDARRWRGPAVAVVVAVVPWLPFEIADPATWDVTRVPLRVHAESGLRLLGVAVDAAPTWTHSLQLVVAVLAGVVVVLRRRWALVPLVVFIARVELDPAGYSYYGTGVILGALVADLLRPLSVPALRTLICSVLMYFVPELAQAFASSTMSLSLVQIIARLAVIPVLLALSWAAAKHASARAGAE